jgi:hypothetical protein
VAIPAATLVPGDVVKLSLGKAPLSLSAVGGTLLAAALFAFLVDPAKVPAFERLGIG